MRKIIIFIGLALVCASGLSAKNQVDFHCSYDADFGSGNIIGKLASKVTSASKDFLRPGIAGKALFIGHDKQDNCYAVEYPDSIIAPDAGTISFWVKPLDWKGSDKYFNMFVSAAGKGQQIYIYKYFNNNQLYFYCQSGEEITLAKCPIKDWSVLEWHFVTCSWNKSELRLYVDGTLRDVVAMKKTFDKAFDSLTVGSLGWEKENEQGSSLLDELKIYKKVISPDDVQKEYNQYSQIIFRAKSPVSITIGQRVPVIDGNIDQFEYSFGGTGFFDLSHPLDKKYSVAQSRYYLSYDDKNFYIGVVTPISQNPVAEKQNRDGNLWEDDSIEVYLLPGLNKAKLHQFIFNTKGILYDSKARNAAWNIEGIKVASETKGAQWTLEVAFPFSQFPSMQPKPGESLKINICRSFKDSMKNTTLGPCNMAYADVPNFAGVMFSRNVPAVDIESIGNLNVNSLDYKMSLLSDKVARATLNLISPKSILPYEVEEKISLNPSTVETVNVQTNNLPPNNILKVNLKLADGIPLYEATFNYKDLAPISISYIYTDADKQILNLVCVNNGCNADQGNQLVLKMVAETGKVVLHKKVPVRSNNLIFTIPLSIATLPPGVFKFIMSGVDKNSKTFFSNWELYRKPSNKPEWSCTKVGLSDNVPAPWTPIEATDKQFKCWGREYSFNNTCLLSSMKSQGRELLAEPIRLTVNGQQVFNSTCRLISANDVMAQYLLTFRTDSVNIKAKIKAEFDGFAWIDLEVTPVSNSVTINTMTLDIPLVRKNIASFDNCQSLRYKMDLTDCMGKKISNNFAKMPACWIGGEDVGLMIGSKNIRGWHVKNKNKSMEIIPGDKAITMRLNLIDTPIKITGTRRIGFYLDATPTKPKNKKVKSYRNLENVTMWSGYWSTCYEYHNLNYLDWTKLEQMSRNKRDKFHYTAAHGASPYSSEWNYYGKEWHSAPPALGAYCVDTDVSNRKLRNRNTFTYGCLDSKSFFDFKLHNLANLINHPRTKIANLYTDLAWPKLCGNKTHGCGWVDEFGDKHSSLDVIGTREYYKRLYKVLKEKNPDAVISTHLVRTRTPADSFADIICFGEAYDHAVAKKESYYDVLTPKEVRVAYASRAQEQEIWLIPQFSRALLLFKPQRMASWKADQKAADLAIKHFIGYMTVHDISFWNDNDVKKRAKQLYVAQDWLGWGDGLTRFYPYWKQTNNPGRVVSPKSDRVMVSTFARDGKALVAILNDTDKTEELVLKIDSKNLFDKDKTYFTGKDAFANDTVKYEIKNSNLKVLLSPRDFKLLMFE